MNGFRRFQRFVPILTLIAALAALGMEIQQRLSNRRAPSGGAPGSHSSTGMPGTFSPQRPDMVIPTVNGMMTVGLVQLPGMMMARSWPGPRR
jgi:hypothetical protein